MSLTANDLLEIRTVVREEVNEAVSTIDGKLKAIENDVKEIYKMISGLQHSGITKPSFKKLTIENKLLRLNTELIEAAKQVGITLPR